MSERISYEEYVKKKKELEDQIKETRFVKKRKQLKDELAELRADFESQGKVGARPIKKKAHSLFKGDKEVVKQFKF